MRKIALFGLTMLLMIIMFGCFPSRNIQYFESCNYDATKNITRFEKLPLGYVDIPGKWYETTYNDYSKQQFFKNADSVSIAVVFWPQNQYSIYKHGETNMAFLKDYYDMNVKTIAMQSKGQWSIIKQDSINQNYILSKFYNDSKVDTYYLYGLINGSFYNLFVKTNKWNEQQKIDFLESMFIHKK